MDKSKKNGANSGELRKSGVTWQVATPSSTEASSAGPPASSSSLAHKASIKRSASSLVSSLISSLGSSSGPSVTRAESAAVSGSSSPKGSGSSFTTATSAAAISNAAGSPNTSTISMIGSFSRNNAEASPFSWSGGSASCNAVMTAGVGLGSFTDPGTLTPVGKSLSRHSLTINSSKRLLPDAVFTPDLPNLARISASSTTNLYAAAPDSKFEAAAGLSDIKQQLAASGTTPNNSAAGGSGIAAGGALSARKSRVNFLMEDARDTVNSSSSSGGGSSSSSGNRVLWATDDSQVAEGATTARDSSKDYKRSKTTPLPETSPRPCWCMADFVIQKKLYEGYASTICKAFDRVSGSTVALKLYHMSKLNSISSHQVAREVRLHIGLDHENIISLYAAFQEAGNVVMVQEFAGGGDLWSFMDANSGRLTERVTVSLVLQPFLRAIHYLHTAGIAHRDIKPENVLFSSGMVLKVADFGLAVNLREERAVTRVGTLDYMAPEVLRCPLKRQPGDNKDRPELFYSQAVDVWAVGVLSYELLTGRAPFSATGASDSAIEAAIHCAAPAFPSRMSEPASSFIAAALHKQPEKRPSILAMLQHPWIRSFQRSNSNDRCGDTGVTLE
ncbi:hypothetical protein OEZ86_004542 [Tetradesmus obliquus]|nr:hypothetical protein OEZ86_004542 [Tetradesmus obliquus]